MDYIKKLSDTDLRFRLARALGYANVRLNPNGQLTCDPGRGVLTFAPLSVPNWPVDTREMSRLEETLGRMGHTDEYARQLLRFSGPDLETSDARTCLEHATGRHRTEAALATLMAVHLAEKLAKPEPVPPSTVLPTRDAAGTVR